MANIFFCAYPISGAINATLKIAKDLQSRGHRVFYLGAVDCEPFLEGSGFDFIALFENWFPRGFVDSREQTASSSKWRGLQENRKIIKLFKEFFDWLPAGGREEFHRVVKKHRPDLVIVVTSNYFSIVWALLAYDARLKSLYFNDTMGRSADIFIPPITTGIIPEPSLLRNLWTSIEWKKHFLRNFFYGKFFSLLGLWLNWERIVVNLAAAFDYPIESIDMSDLVTPKLKLPELIPFPREFDFPNSEKPGRYNIESSVDSERKQALFPWDRLDDSRPLIYCGLGSLIYLDKAEYRKFFQTVLEVSKVYDQWQWVLAIGKTLDENEFDFVPSNVVVVRQAPQLDLLKRAHLAITHGGSNSVKECILAGVPMIVFPLGFDQPGIAARVVYHGLGVKGNIYKTDVKSLSSLIEKIARNSFYFSQSKIMQHRFQEKEAAGIGVQIIETILRQNTLR